MCKEKHGLGKKNYKWSKSVLPQQAQVEKCRNILTL